MNDVFRTIWRFRIAIISVFIALFVLDVVVGAMRMIVVEVAIFVFGVVVGRMHHAPAPIISPPVISPTPSRDIARDQRE